MNSIKESFDNLPVAVCFFDKRGVVRLMNRRMLSVGAELLGSGVQTLEELHRALDTPPESIERLDAEMGVYKFPSLSGRYPTKAAAAIRRSPPRT